MNNFQTSVKDIQSNLLSHAFILTSNRDDAYALLNDTNSAVLAHEDAIPASGSVKDWAFAVMKSIFNSKYAAHHHTIEVDTRYYQITISEEQYTTAGVSEIHTLTDELQALDPIYSSLYNLYIAGYTCEEIAHREGLPQATVSGRLSYAARMLQGRIATRA